jgi:hypothetical protein
MAKQNSDVPVEIQNELNDRVKKFNEEKLSKSYCKYDIVIKGKFIYLNHQYQGNTTSKVARLTYNGDINKMYFAIYKYSSEMYDPNEFFYPGSEFINGTIEGAMKAGLKAYAP